MASGAAKLVSVSSITYSIRLFLVGTVARTSRVVVRRVETAPQIPLLSPVGPLEYVCDSATTYPTRYRPLRFDAMRRLPRFCEP